jgi:hypothetical protein
MGDSARLICVATLFTVEPVTGIEPAGSAWELLERLGISVIRCGF